MQAKDTSLFNILTDSTIELFNIPNYQRPYSWEKDQVENLLESIHSLKETSKYFGSILTYKPDNSDTLDIVDGQQRLITFSLFAYALRKKYDYFIKSNKLNAKYSIWENTRLFYENSDSDLKLNLLAKDNDNFKNLISNDKISKGKICDNYNTINKWLDETSEGMEEEEVIAFFNTLATNFYKLVLVVKIDINNNEDYFEIFQTMNSQGLPLAFYNLVKSKFSSSKEKGFEEKWVSLFESNSDFWDENTSIGNEKDSYLGHFFKFYLTLKYPDKLTFKEKEKAFNKEIFDVMSEMKTIEAYAKTYKHFFEDIKNKKFDSCFSRLAIIMSTYNTYVFIPVILKHVDNEETLNIIENYLMRNFATNKLLYRNMNQHMSKILNDSKYILNLKLKYATDEDIKTAFNETWSNSKARTLLTILNKKLDYNKSTTTNLNVKLTLDHILPQNGETIKSLEEEDKRYIYFIGNMGLLTQSENSSKSNKEEVTNLTDKEKIENIKNKSNELCDICLKLYPSLT